jgi:hypothetical protein
MLRFLYDNLPAETIGQGEQFPYLPGDQISKIDKWPQCKGE